MNEFLIELQAKLDEAGSKKNINDDLGTISKAIEKLKVQAEIDPNSVKNIAQQLATIMNQKIVIGNIQVDPGKTIKDANATGKQIGQQIQAGANSVIQKGFFVKSFTANPKNFINTAKYAESYFKTLSNVVSVEEKLGENNNLTGFTVSLKNAEGVVEKLIYKYNELKDGNGNVIGKLFEYSGGSINDNGVIKQINTISTKADSLQNKLDKLKANYSDLNTSKPIKNSNNILSLSQQYDKVATAIENVRNADNSTFSSMVSNAQREITVLETMVSKFRNAENVSTQMKGFDISSGIAQAQERFSKLKASSLGFDQMKQAINELDYLLSSVGDKSSLDNFINKLRVAETQLNRVKAETKSMAQVNKIQLQVETGGAESKVAALIDKTNQWTDVNGNARISTANLTTALHELVTASNEYANNKTEATQKRLTQANEKLDAEYKKVASSVRKMNAELAKDSAVASLHNKVTEFMGKNGKAVKYFGKDLKDIFNKTTQGAEVSKQKLAQLNQQLINVQNTARATGKLGKTFFQTLKEGMSSFTYWTSSTFMVMKAFQSIKSGISTVKELDTALVDLKKTTTMTNSELQEFYYDANETAKEMGVSTQQIIEQASAWSRLGFGSADQATKMAKYSSMFATISPGMDIDSATDGLVSVMKAFKIGLDDSNKVVDGIMSKINSIGNSRALSNNDIVEFLRRSSSAMAEANNSLEETISLGTAATEITRDAASVGNALKTVSMRIRGYDEETEEYIGGIEELSGEIADLTKTVSTPGGISLFTDEAKTEFKSTKQLFDEIASIYQDLTDKNQAQLLETLAGKRQGQIVGSILNNYDAVSNSMDTMENSAGNAEKEMSVVVDKQNCPYVQKCAYSSYLIAGNA